MPESTSSCLELSERHRFGSLVVVVVVIVIVILKAIAIIVKFIVILCYYNIRLFV